MSFPQTIDPSSPIGTDSPAQGDNEFRALKLYIAEVFGLPQSPATIAAPISLVGVDGQAPTIVRLTNQTGGALVAGDVVALSAANDKAVNLSDVSGSLIPMVIAAESINNATEGRFYSIGVVSAKSQGSIARGEYVRKSATTKAIETTGLPIGAAVPATADAIGVSLAANSGGFTTIYKLLEPRSRVPGADFLNFVGISTPATPASGSGALYSPSSVTGLRTPAWIDAGGQVTTFTRVLTRDVGNPIKTVVSTAAETSLFTAAPTIKANTLIAGRHLRAILFFDGLNNFAAAQSFTLRLKLGGTAVMTIAYTLWAQSATRIKGQQGFGVFAVLSNSQHGVELVRSFVGNTPTAATLTAGNTVADSTTDLALDWTVQLSSANANLDFRPFSIIVEIV